MENIMGTIIEEMNWGKTETDLITCDFDDLNMDGATALLHAIAQGKSEMAIKLINNGADVNEATDDDISPLILSLIKTQELKNKEMLKLISVLIEKGADVKEVIDFDGQEVSPLILAMEIGINTNNFHIAKSLIDAGADVNEELNDQTMLLYMLQDNDIGEYDAAIEFLVDNGAK